MNDARALLRVLPASVVPTERLLRACAALGVCVRRVRPADLSRTLHDDARRLLASLRPGEVVLVSGPSGSGKSTLLRAVARAARDAGLRVCGQRPVERARCVIDLIPGSLGEAIACLVRAGLGDVGVLARTPGELSEGERARVALAAALARVRPGAPGHLLLLDEFASTLDRASAARVGAGVRRWATRTGVRVVVATAHDDLRGPLAPDVRVRCARGRSGTTVHIERGGGA
ncbi:MAG: ATP-binding cassette domain-containing protein [Planctomycetota bacterium]|nr:ATP-binding cassette domain-containing protein [Planctomycetota bacterium]